MHEMQFGRGMDGQAPTQLSANEAGGLAQACQGIFHRFRIIVQRGEKYFRVRVIRRHLHFGNRDHADPRVFQFIGNDFRKIALDLVGTAHAAARNGFAVFSHDENRTLLLLFSGRLQYCNRPPKPLQRTRDFLYLENFQLIADLDVIEVLQRQAAFEAGFHFLHIILEAFQRIEFAGPHHDVVAQQTH
jgi:hypothetical protein